MADYKQYNRERDSGRGDAIDTILNDRVVGLELIDTLLGEYVGAGCFRYVFNHRFDKNLVIKIEKGHGNANAMEFQTWFRVQEVKSINKWFAKCHYISKCGRILIQEKVKANAQDFNFKRPTKIPSFFTDTKWENFGYRGQQLVCLDYASTLLMEQGMKLTFKKADW